MKSVVAHGALAIVGLTVAYMVWTKGEEPEVTTDEEVTIVECTSAELTSLTLHTKQRDVKLEMRGQGEARAAWFRVTRRQTPPTPPTATPGGDPPSATPPPATVPDEVKQFVGSSAVTEYLTKAVPFRAIRSLGPVDAPQLEELELKTPETSIEIACGGRARTFQIGGTAFGTGDRYAREASGGPVYLLKAEIVRDLESAEFRMMQRDLHTFEMSKVQNIRVRAFDQERTLLQRNRENQQQANNPERWVDASTPDQQNAMYGNWLERVGRLRVQDYLAPDTNPGSEVEGRAAQTPIPVMQLTYLDDGGDELGRLELVRVDAAAGSTTPLPSPAPAEYYARSEATHGWVKVMRSIADEVEHDVRPIVGLEALPDEPTAPAIESSAPGAPPGLLGAPGASPASSPLPMGHPAVPLPVPTPTVPPAVRARPPASPPTPPPVAPHPAH